MGYESGNQQILQQHQEGHAARRRARAFTKDCHELGITIHGTFILGLPGETRETIEETIRFAIEIDPHTRAGLAGRALSRHRALRRRRVREGWLDTANADYVDAHGVQIAPLALPAPAAHRDLRQRRDLLPPLLLPRRRRSPRICGEMLRDRQMLVRRLREGVEFFRFLRERAQSSPKAAA